MPLVSFVPEHKNLDDLANDMGLIEWVYTKMAIEYKSLALVTNVFPQGEYAKLKATIDDHAALYAGMPVLGAPDGDPETMAIGQAAANAAPAIFTFYSKLYETAESAANSADFWDTFWNDLYNNLDANIIPLP